MWLLIKGSFWTTATLVALSFIAGQPQEPAEGQTQIQVSDAIGAATEAYGYISGLCAEKPVVCEKGAETFVALQHRARDGARVAYEIIDRHLAEKEAGTSAEKHETAAMPAGGEDALTTGSIAIPLPQAKPVR